MSFFELNPQHLSVRSRPMKMMMKLRKTERFAATQQLSRRKKEWTQMCNLHTSTKSSEDMQNGTLCLPMPVWWRVEREKKCAISIEMLISLDMHSKTSRFCLDSHILQLRGHNTLRSKSLHVFLFLPSTHNYQLFPSFFFTSAYIHNCSCKFYYELEMFSATNILILFLLVSSDMATINKQSDYKNRREKKNQPTNAWKLTTWADTIQRR